MNSLRREEIRKYIETNNIATLEQLTALMPDVSLMTIHRDLNFLQDQGLVQKIRGGARYIGGGATEPAFSARQIVNKEQKLKLGEKAIKLLGASNSIFIDAGTTMMTFARLLPDNPTHVVTTSPNIAIELAKKQNLVVDICGGTLNKQNLTISGSYALEMLSHINIDMAFLVASGYTTSSGFTCGKESEAQIKSLIIERARRTYVLMDTSKIDRLLPYTFAKLENIDSFVTDANPSDLPDYIKNIAKKNNITLL